MLAASFRSTSSAPPSVPQASVGNLVVDQETDSRLIRMFHGPVLPGHRIPPIQGIAPQQEGRAEDDFPIDPGDADADPIGAPLFDVDQTFKLHSRPDSKFTIYLDFDGHTTIGTSWNTGYGIAEIVHPNYWGGTGANFSTARLELIQDIWQVVAEDFAPFDVNVTTEEPLDLDDLRYNGSGDTRWGSRVVMTKDTFADCGCGGHAYLGAFDDRQDEPALVYNGGLGAGSETVSHEVGHQLGLNHDGVGSTTYYRGHGSGDTSWGPIMGAPFSKQVTQWSNGDYFNASNTTQDDLSVITRSVNFPYVQDDHANERVSATWLQESNTTDVHAFGIIETNDDVDWFRFASGGGSVSLDINVLGYKPNLDVWAGLYDSSGVFITDANPQETLSASFQNLTLDAGEYFIKVDGVPRDAAYDSSLDEMVEPTPPPYTVSSPLGFGDYGSLGQYQISGTIIDPGVATVSVAATTDSVDEGAIAEFVLTTSDGSSGDVTIAIRSTRQSAPSLPAPDSTEPEDFAASSSQVVSIVDGQATLQIPIIDDALVENTETFEIQIIDSGSFAVADRTARMDVIESKSAYSIFAVNADTVEGDAADDQTHQFNVQRLGRTDAAQVLGWRRIAVGDDPADDMDFTTASTGTIEFGTGQIVRSIDVGIRGDIVAEPDETYAIELFIPEGETFLINPSRSSALAQIDDDESVISLTSTVRFDEGDSGTNNQSISISRTGYIDKAIAVDWTVGPGVVDSVDADDFVGGFPTGTVNFTAGQDSAVIEIQVAADTLVEPDESFLLTVVSNSGGPILNSTLNGEITNDDFVQAEINVLGGVGIGGAVQTISNGDRSPDLADGTDFGFVGVGSGGIVRDFTIQNIGVLDLNITSVHVSTEQTSNFSITRLPDEVIPPGAESTFGITFDPTIAGRQDSIVEIMNDDPNESNFTFAVTGIGTDLAVDAVQINQGLASRSQLTSVKVSFNQHVEHQSLYGAFEIRNVSSGESIRSISAEAIDMEEKTEVMLTFGSPNAGVVIPDDGNYQLRVLAASIMGVGNESIRLPEDYLFGTLATDAFFRHFGDTDGDRDVDGQDMGRFGLALLQESSSPNFNSQLDFDADGDVDGRDYGELDMRFLKRLEF